MSNDTSSTPSSSGVTALDTSALADISRSISMSCYIGCDDSVSYQAGSALLAGTGTGPSILSYQVGESAVAQLGGGGGGNDGTAQQQQQSPATTMGHMISTASYAGSEVQQTELLRRQQAKDDEDSSMAAFRSEWEVVSRLGGGGFGEVLECYRRSDPNKIHRAVKASRGSQGTIKELENEVELLMLIPSHPNVVQPLQFIHSTGTASSIAFLVMEYCEMGSLQSLVEKSAANRLPEETVCEIAHQLLTGLAFLSRSGVVHKDIKPPNVLISKDPRNENRCLYKLADFGLSSLAAKGSGTDGNPGGGTVRFMPRESLVADSAGSGSSGAADLWALGATLTYLLTGVKPWSDHPLGADANDFWKLRALIVNVPYSEKERASHHPTIPEWLSDEGTSFIKQLFHLDPVKRGTAQQLLAHPWIRGGTSASLSASGSSSTNSLSPTSQHKSSLSSPTTGVSSPNDYDNIDRELLAAAVQQVEDQPDDARLWAIMGRLCAMDETVEIAGKNYTRRQCLRQACRLAPERLMLWNLLGRELVMLNSPEYHRGSVLLAQLQARRATSPPKVEEIDVDATDCFVKCLELNETAVGYRNLGLSLQPGQTATVRWKDDREPETFTKAQAYLRAVQLAPEEGAGWVNLGVATSPNSTVVVSGVSYTKLQLFITALTKTPWSAPAWGNLGNLLRSGDTTMVGAEKGAGETGNKRSGDVVMVGAERVNKIIAHTHAIECFPAATHWNNLGHALPLGGETIVGGRRVSKLEAFMNALAMDHQNAGRYRTLGFYMRKEKVAQVQLDLSGSGSATVYQPLDCYLKAAMLQPSNSIRWTELASLMTDLGVTEVQLAENGEGSMGSISVIEILVKAASLDPSDSFSLYQLWKLLEKNEAASPPKPPLPEGVEDDELDHEMEPLSAKSTRVRINGVVCTAQDCKDRLFVLLRQFYSAVDEFNGAQVTDHDRIYTCAQGHPMLTHKSSSWRCDVCRSRDRYPGDPLSAVPTSLACRSCDQDICYKSCFVQMVQGIEALPTELALGTNFAPTLSNSDLMYATMSGATAATSPSSSETAAAASSSSSSQQQRVTVVLGDNADGSVSWTQMTLEDALKVTEHKEMTARAVVLLEHEQSFAKLSKGKR